MRQVKLADLGLARVFDQPLRSFTVCDPVVVTMWCPPIIVPLPCPPILGSVPSWYSLISMLMPYPRYRLPLPLLGCCPVRYRPLVMPIYGHMTMRYAHIWSYGHVLCPYMVIALSGTGPQSYSWARGTTPAPLTHGH